MTSITDIQELFGHNPNAVQYVNKHREDASAIKTYIDTFTGHAPDAVPDIQIYPGGDRVRVELQGTASQPEYDAAMAAVRAFRTMRSASIRTKVTIEPAGEPDMPSQ